MSHLPAPAIFERIVCGVDGSEASLEAVRQADRLLAPDGALTLVAAADLTQTIHPRIAPTAVHVLRKAVERADELERQAAAALQRARTAVQCAANVTTVQTEGLPAFCLIDAAQEQEASLLAVGSHGLGRAAGIILGSVATRLLHDAPCPVLVARPPRSFERFPSAILVGMDWSPQAEAALETARVLEARFGACVRTLTVEGGSPERALLQAAHDADLVMLGSRGLHGLRSLGSVSERVAHQAPCSVLVFR